MTRLPGPLQQLARLAGPPFLIDDLVEFTADVRYTGRVDDHMLSFVPARARGRVLACGRMPGGDGCLVEIVGEDGQRSGLWSGARIEDLRRLERAGGAGGR